MNEPLHKSGQRLADITQGWHLPRETDSAGVLSPGLHLLSGVPGAGKTVTSLALCLSYESEGYPAAYHNVLEPRGFIFAPEGDAAALARFQARTDAGGGTIRSSYADFLAREFHRLTVRAKKSRPYERTGLPPTPILVLDTVNFLLEDLPETVLAMQQRDDAAYEGGLRRGLQLGVLHHQMRAFDAGVALVGCVNPQAVPVVERLSVFIEGVVSITRPGEFSASSREIARTWMRTRIPQWALNLSFSVVYGERVGRAPSIRSTDVITLD